jgi:hypothetical protein
MPGRPARALSARYCPPDRRWTPRYSQLIVEFHPRRGLHDSRPREPVGERATLACFHPGVWESGAAFQGTTLASAQSLAKSNRGPVRVRCGSGNNRLSSPQVRVTEGPSTASHRDITTGAQPGCGYLCGVMHATSSGGTLSQARPGSEGAEVRPGAWCADTVSSGPAAIGRENATSLPMSRAPSPEAASLQ